MKKWTQNWTTPVKVLLAGVGISTMALLAPLVISATPSANSVIGNQAGATYKDAAGKDQTALSNLVTTTVAQVAGITLTNDNTKSVAAGNTAYMPHSLTNSGNGNDTFKVVVADSVTPQNFTGVVVYPDANGTGVPSGSALCNDASTTTTPPKCSDGFLQSVPAGQTFNFVVAYTVPASATAAAPFETATVTVTSQSPTTVTGTRTATRTDVVNVTGDAAFTANKAIKAPAIPAAGSGASWPAAVTSGKASCVATTANTTWSSTLVSANPTCTYTVYTISYTNTGGATGNFSMQDVIGTGATAGLTYVTGSAVWSGAGGTALNDTATSTTTGSGASQAKSSFSSSTFKATVTNVAPNVSGTISFVALLNSTAAVGSTTTNNVAGYWSTTCDSTATAVAGGNCDGKTTPPSTTNPAPLPVLPTYSVVAANASTATTVDVAIPTKSGENLVKQDAIANAANTVAQGGTASFVDYVINRGTGIDTFNLALATDATNNTFPTGTTFAFFKEDGVTPLTDTNSDGVVDTGPLAPGAYVKIVVKATVPATAAVAAATAADVLLTATSASDATKKDYVWNEVAGIVAPTSKVDLTNSTGGNQTSVNGATPTDCSPGVNCDLGQGPSPSPTYTKSVTPGATIDFPVFIKNTTGASATYDLTSTVPPGWMVKITKGTTCPGTPITSITVASGLQETMTACVTPPVGTPAGTTPIDITATKQGETTVTDTLRDAVTVTNPAAKPDMQLGPDGGSTNVNNGGTVVQPTTLTNTGTTQCGAGGSGLTAKVTFDPKSLAAGWQAVLYYDKNTNGIVDSLDKALSTLVSGSTDTYVVTDTTLGLSSATTPTTLVPLAVGGKLPLLVKLFAPNGANNGDVATVTLVLHDTNTDATAKCPDDTATFTSTVLASQLRVTKTQMLDTGCSTSGVETASKKFVADPLSITPDPVAANLQCIVYKVIAENQGGAPISTVVLNDVIPAFTTYSTTNQPATQCASGNGTTGTMAFVAPATGSKAVSCGTATSIPPLGTMTMTFTVVLDK